MFTYRFSFRSPSISTVAFAGAFLFTSALAGCSDDDAASPGDDAGAGGAGGTPVGAGGTSSSGGASSGGKTATGGASTSGGAPGSSGAGNTSGSTNSGGQSPDGGESGGASNSGGGTSTGGTSSGGASSTGGTSSGGASNSGGVTGSGGERTDGGAGDAGPEGGSGPDGSVAPDGGTPRARLAFVGLTDYIFAAFTSVDLATGNVLHTYIMEGQAFAVGHDGEGFIVERNNAIVDTLDSEGNYRHRINLTTPEVGDPVGSYLNPRDVVPVPGTNKAYVSLGGANKVAILDVEAGTVTGTVDLSAFVADGQDRVVMDTGTYDPRTGKVYFLLQRSNLPSFECGNWPALLVGIDPVTNTVADINGAAAGQAVALTLKQPTSLALHDDDLYVLAVGCNDPAQANAYVSQGIEVVDLAAGTAQPVYTTTDQNYALGLALLDGNRAVVSRNSLDYLSIEWNVWDVGSSSLGRLLAGAPPIGAAVETGDSLIGSVTVPIEGGTEARLVRYGVTSGQSTVVAVNPWALDPATVSSNAGVVILE